MLKSQVLTLFFTYLICISAEEKKADSRIDDFLRPPSFDQAHPAEAPSYFSKFKNWMFSFGGSGSADVTLPPHPPPPKNTPGYLPPPGKTKECNPCDEEPWVPILSNHGKDSAISFLHTSELQKPSAIYGAPNIQSKPIYGPPNVKPGQPLGLGGLLPPKNHHPKPPQIYGPPKPQSNFALPVYGPPPNFHPPKAPSNYGPPNFNPPKPISNYAPAKPPSNYGPPKPGPSYGPPISSPSYSPQKPPSNYGPPKLPSFVLSKPSSGYGPPKLSSGYGPPKPPSHFGPPKPNPSYGPPVQFTPPKPTSQYGPPNNNFGPLIDSGLHIPPSASPIFTSPPSLNPPVTLSFGPPTPIYAPHNIGPSQGSPFNLPKEHLSAPHPTPHYSVPNFKPLGPSPGDNKPFKNYGLPSFGSRLPPIKPDIPPPKIIHGNKHPSSAPNFGTSAADLVPPPPTSISPQHHAPVSTLTQAPFEYLSPPRNIISTGSLPLSQSNVNLPHSGYSGPVVDSYGPPPSGPVNNPDAIFATNPGILPPSNISPLIFDSDSDVSSAGNPPDYDYISKLNFLKPIPFPNMSPNLILPLHEAQPFNDVTGGGNIILHQQGSYDNVQSPDVSISQSIPVSSYGSVEYSPTVIQSPIIDVTVADDEKNDDGDLSKNPIVVDGDIHHQEASFTSVTVHNETIDQNYRSERKNGVKKSTADVESSLEILVSKDNIGDVIAKEVLNEKEDKHNSIQISDKNSDKKSETVQTSSSGNIFTPPPMDYSSWSPAFGGLSTSMNPPPPQHQNWGNKLPKQIQIIVPYISNGDKNNWHQNQGRKVPSPPPNPTYPTFSNLPTQEESQWTKYMPRTETKSVSNIGDLLKDVPVKSDNSRHLPFDIVDLQKNIDVWTELEYNNGKTSDVINTNTRFTHSKKIPEDFLPTLAYDVSKNEITTVVPFKNSKSFYDYAAAGSQNTPVKAKNYTKYSDVDGSFASNLINVDTTQKVDTTSKRTAKDHFKNSWESTQVSVSPLTHERVYVVTPQPISFDSSTPLSAWTFVPSADIQEINEQLAKDDDDFAFSSPRFVVRPEPLVINRTEQASTSNKTVHFVYEDWPKLINSLESTTTEAAPTTLHPLFGRMDMSAHTEPAPQNVPQTVPQTVPQAAAAHAKITPDSSTSAPKKRTGLDEKKTISKSSEKS